MKKLYGIFQDIDAARELEARLPRKPLTGDELANIINSLPADEKARIMGMLREAYGMPKPA